MDKKEILTEEKSRKIKVYLQKPWKTTDSQYYKLLRDQPPRGVEYVNAKEFKLIKNKRKLWINNLIKQNVKKFIKKFFSNLPNAHITKNSTDYDLIHCAHCLSKNNQPWVCDIEYVGQFWASAAFSKERSSKVQKILLSDSCKKILAWTEWSKKGIIEGFPEIADKVEVVYPGIPKQKSSKKSSKDINLLFVGRDFKLKGGALAVEIFDFLTKKYPEVYAKIVSDIPSEIIKKYSHNKKIKFRRLVSQKTLFEQIYPSADIFLYPTFSDTFGFAILEAQAFGLPVIAMQTRDTHTIQETIKNGKTGFIINAMDADSKNQIAPKRVLEELTERLEGLIKNKKKLKKLSKTCVEEIERGKFSMKLRNEKLGKIYKAAVRTSTMN